MKGRASANACAATARPFDSTDRPAFTQPRITKGSKTVSFQVVRTCLSIKTTKGVEALGFWRTEFPVRFPPAYSYTSYPGCLPMI